MQFARKKPVRCKIDNAILVERLCAQTVLTRVRCEQNRIRIATQSTGNLIYFLGGVVQRR
jgi:hypothetical protein